MPIEFKKTVAVCNGVCSIEEAETLLGWLLENPKGKVNLKSCEQLHTAIVQVLMASKVAFSALPDNAAVQQQLLSCNLIETGDR